jgi:biotin carboxyl carrier protein
MDTYLTESFIKKSQETEINEQEEKEPSLDDLMKFANTDLRQLIYVFKDSAAGRLKMDNGEISVGMVKKLSPPPKTLLAPREGQAEEMPQTLKPVTSKYLGILRLQGKKGTPLVSPGEYVKKGQTLAIVETLNIKNEIKADRSGVVVEIFEEDGRPVEYGEILFLIDTGISNGEQRAE